MYGRKLIKSISRGLIAKKNSKRSGKKLATFGNLVADKIKKKK
tara:strand:+ start:435 stop:563 length:129 start_codon:yes stop_codon:yes gene_type:complete